MNKFTNNLVENSLLGKAWRSKTAIFLMGLIGAMLFFMISAIIPASYKAFASIAVNQTRTGGLDAYREAKSSEFIAQTIKEMITANSFMQTVLDDREINWREMEKNKSQDEKIKFWRKKVKISVVPNTGVLHIAVYSQERELSKKIAGKIVAVLQNDKITFFNNKGIRLEVIDEPYYFYKPAFPNLIFNTIVGFILGIFLFVILIVIDDGGNNRVEPILNLGFRKNNRKNKYIELNAEDFNK